MKAVRMHRQRRLLLQAGLGLALGAGLPRPTLAARPLRIFLILFRGETAVERGFRSYFAERGIAVQLTLRDLAGDMGKVPALIAEARALQADLIYTWGTSATLAVVGAQGHRSAARHVTDIPVVFVMVTSPEASGLVTKRSGGRRNFTGAVHVVPLERQLDAMRAYRPLRHVASIYNPLEPNSRQVMQELQEAAQHDGFAFSALPVPMGADGLPRADALAGLVQQAAQHGANLLYAGPDTFLAVHRKVFTGAALQAGLPVFSATEIALREGDALFGLVAPYEAVGRLAGRMADQILRGGVAPQDIAIETLGRFSYLVNMRVAAQLKAWPPLNVVNYAEIIR